LNGELHILESTSGSGSNEQEIASYRILKANLPTGHCVDSTPTGQLQTLYRNIKINYD